MDKSFRVSIIMGPLKITDRHAHVLKILEQVQMIIQSSCKVM